MYSHDGLKDSLTNHAAPPLFYEELRREIAKRNRSRHELQILRVVLVRDEHSRYSESQLSSEVVDLGHALASTIRGQDVCARMGEYEFLLLFTGKELVVVAFLSRVTQKWNENEHVLSLAYSIVTSVDDESGLDLLNRLDRELLLEFPV